MRFHLLGFIGFGILAAFSGPESAAETVAQLTVAPLSSDGAAAQTYN